MHDCQRYHDLIASYIAGDLGPAEMKELGTHSVECEDCRGLLELHRSFATAALGLVEPSEETFEAMRNRVLDQLEFKRSEAHVSGRSPAGAVDSGRPFWSALPEWLGVRPAYAAAAGILLLAAGGLAGRWTASPEWSDRSVLRAVENQASASAGLDGFWNAPFTIANVALRPTGAGDLSLGFDACRRVEVQTPRSSPLAREVLLSTIIDSPRLGERIKAMDLAPGTDDAHLQDALIYTLHNDPNLAVRLQALEVLGRSPLNAAKQDALLTTLRSDVSVQVRLEALHALSAGHVDPEIIRRAASEGGQQSDAVLWQLATGTVGGS